MSQNVSRRHFLRIAGAGAAMAAGHGLARARAGQAAPSKTPETLVKRLYDSFSDAQRRRVSFEWDYVDPRRGLLRTRVANNWRITEPAINGDFYTLDQQHLIREIFEGIIQPDWHARIDKQLQDDNGGFGVEQSIAVFGNPGQGKFEFVLTGRHITLRCDGHSATHLAFGGPIFYGHAASGFHEKPGHPGNVFWPQALAANGVFAMLDGKQQRQALLKAAPPENQVGFRGRSAALPGIPIAELSADQKAHAQQVLQKLIEPYRLSDRQRVMECLKTEGGLDACHLAFYEEGHRGKDPVWDIWRLEGPAFVWHFRGTPHVHTWVHVADDPTMKLNA
jgi:hypothetical protein